MKNILTAFFIVLFLVVPSIFWGQTSTFQKVYSSTRNLNATSLLKTSQGNYLMSGGTSPTGSPSSGSRNIFLMMLDSTGQVLWQKSYQSNRTFSKCIETSDGGFLVLGFVGNSSNEGTLLLKIDSIGNIKWSRKWADKAPEGILPLADGAVVSCTDGNVSRSFAMRINYDGDVLWSKMYDVRLLLKYVQGDTIFGVGPLADLSTGQEGCLVKISTSTGVGYSSTKIYGNFQYDRFHRLLPASDGDFILFGYNGYQSTARLWVVKIDRDGSVKWSKRFGTTFNELPVVYSVKTTPDDGVVFAGFRNGFLDPVLFKINSSGEVLWSRLYGPADSGGFYDILTNIDCSLLAVGVAKFSDIPPIGGISLMKTDAYGEVEGCCSSPYNLPSADYVVSTSSFTPAATDHFGLDTAIVEVFSENIEMQDFCHAGFSPTQTQQEIQLCPGETVNIGGNSYTAPAIVTDSLFNAVGCDSVITYTLSALPYNTRTETVGLCPGDTVVISGNVYTQPGIVIDTLPGLGSCDTIVTYQLECAEPPAAPCDVKTNGCVTFELLRITRDAQSRKTYHIRVVNNCSNELIYTAFQLPNGIVADVPSNSSIFTTSSGRTYEVRNPNFSPFYSVRYKTLGLGLQNGQSDEFRYTLPPQSAPTYIHVLVKLAAQNFVEAHLNVFNCPVQNEADKDDFAHDRTNGKNLKLSQFNLFPNPSSGTLVVDFSDREMDEQIEFRLLNAQGQLIHEFEILPEASRQMLNLPNDLPDGLYLLEAKTKNAELVTKRFLIQK